MVWRLHSAAAVLLLATSQHAAAQNAFPATTVAACQKISGPAKISTTKVRFKTGTTGKIVLACPLNSGAVSGAAATKRLVMKYRDSSGTGSSASVKAKLFVANSATGAVSVSSLFNSNDFAETTYDAQFSPVNFPTLNSDNFSYSIQIELSRSNASKVVEFHSFTVVGF